LTKNTKQNKAFKAFIAQGGESLQTLAVFEALQENLKAEGKACWGWPVFPDEFKAYDMPSVAKFAKKNKKRVHFYLFLQWHAALQFEAASKAASEAGMLIGLYRDLAVGVSEGGAEIWGNKDLYCVDASIGAPPDVLGPLGQTWGLPPMDPIKLYEQAYQPIIDLFSSNMHASGALRIDHVMALLRLWWVYKGDHASQGGYVCYPVEDLLGILALESQRNQSLVIGEDLGTVPQEIRSTLAENGMYSYRVFLFEQAEDGGFYAPEHYPEQSMATLTTHDMPTLIGYWHCNDLALGKEIGLYPDADVLATLYDARHDNKQHILNTLHGHHSISNSISHNVNDVGMTTELNYGMQTHMASSSSALLSLQLEDWLQMEKPVNIPGTFNEYPNWKRKLSRNLEDIFEDDAILSLSQTLTNRRSVASKT
ncbi:MAG: 4-alpha-glucanotransferase, partial [Glaciecola sp.]